MGLCAALLPPAVSLADMIDLIDEVGATPPEAMIYRQGKQVSLDQATQDKVSAALRTLLESCRADSKTRASLFRKYNKDYPFNWDRATDPLRGVSYIQVSLGKLEKLRAGNKNVYAKHLLLETPAGNWPRKYMVAYDGSTAIQFTKCSGLVTVDIICMPEIREHLPESYAPACKVVPDMKDEADKVMHEAEEEAR